MLSAAEIARLVDEVADRVVGGRVQKISGPTPERFVIEVFDEGGKHHVLIALEPELPRLHLTAKPPPSAPSPFPLVEVLRKHLVGSRVKECVALPNERIVRFTFAVLVDDRPDERLLFCELFPKGRNLVLTDADLKILGLLRSGGVTRKDVRHGGVWSAPPASGHTPAQDVEPFQFLDELPEAGGLSAAIEAWAEPQASASRHERVQRALAGDLRKRAKKERRLVENLKKELDDAARSEEVRRHGELIKQNLGTIPKGATEVTLTDYSRDEEQVVVKLDPKESPLDAMNRHFKQAKKLDKALPKVAMRLGNAEDRLAELEAFIIEVDAQDDLDALVALHQKAVQKGWARADAIPKGGTAKEAPKKKVQERRKPYRTFTSKDGIEILVGRTAVDNDELSLRIGKGNEHWMHVAGYAGSHVVIRFTGEDLPPETLLDAATLAAHYSQAPKGSRAEIHRTRCKYVSKFRGANPGQVQLAKYKGLRIVPDSRRLDRLVNSPK